MSAEKGNLMKLLRRMLVMLVLAGLVFGAIAGFNWYKARMVAKFVKQFSNPAESVATMVATPTVWHHTLDAVGSLRAVRGANLATDVDGIVAEIDFTSGQEVRQGDVLLRLRTEDDAGRLKQLQSALSLAQSNYQRDLRQLAAQAVARATVDADLSALHQAEAAVAAQQALMAKKILVAPFSGRLGLRQVDTGQFLAAGTTVVSLQALDPIFVDFYVPQEYIASLRPHLPISLHLDAYPGRVFAGTIQSLNAQLDTATRTLQVRGILPNPHHQLLPGMFGHVAITLGLPESYITLPQTALSYNPYGDTVYVVETRTDHGKKTLVARQVFVKVGPTRGDQVAILDGISPGSTIVVAGVNKLHNGTPVTINNTILPLDQANPHPAEE